VSDRKQDFETRFAEEFREYLTTKVSAADAKSAARAAMTAAPRTGTSLAALGGLATTGLAVLVVLAVVLLRSGVARTPPSGESSQPTQSAADTSRSPASPPASTKTLTLGDVGHVSYPASWIEVGTYYAGRARPWGRISSGALGPCATSSCQFFTVPPDVVLIEFDWNPAVPGMPPYSGPTNDAVGGQPAYREDWGPVNAVDADEGHTWLLHLKTGTLVIDGALKGPDLAGGRAALQEILASVVVADPSPSASAEAARSSPVAMTCDPCPSPNLRT
jgi:hypothetical protein